MTSSDRVAGEVSHPSSIWQSIFHDWGERTWCGKLRLAAIAPLVYGGLAALVAYGLAIRLVRNAWPSVYKEGLKSNDDTTIPFGADNE